jgi:hypothetical protein
MTSMRGICMALFLSLVAAADEVARPELTATLCQGWDEHLTPEGPTTTFFADSASVRLVARAKGPLPAGMRLTPWIVSGLTPVCRGQEVVADGKFDVVACGFHLAGQQWAAAGGEFRFRLSCGDDDPTPLIEVPFTVKAAQRWALCVGISDYPPAGAGGSDLPACHKDAERMRDLLVNSFGFAADHVTVVQSLDATTARIESELVSLAEKAGPEDAVLFSYCGHGTQIPDLNGDEEDGWDEALATAEDLPGVVTTADFLGRFLSDDRLAELLGKFRTRNVTVLFDSCHSGTAVREAGAEPVAAPGFLVGMKKEVGFGRDLVAMAEDADRSHPKGVAEGLDLDQRYVFVSAAQSWETAMGGADGGVFSLCLREVLRTSNGESWETIAHRVRGIAQSMNPGQSAQVEGATRRYPFCTTEAPADAPYVRPTMTVFDAAPGQQGKELYVAGMAALALEQGGVECDVFPAGDEPCAGAPKGRVRLTGAMAKMDRGEGLDPWTFAGATILDGSALRGDRLLPRAVRVPRAQPSVGIAFLKDTGEAAIEKMRSTVQALVNLLQSERSVDMRTDGSGGLDYIVVPQLRGDEVIAQIYTPASVFVGSCRGGAGDIASSVRDMVVARHLAFSRINRISNPSPSFRLRTVLKGGVARRPRGSTLEFTGYVDRPACLYAFAAIEGGEMSLIAAADQPLAPDAAFSFPYATQAALQGRVVVKVIATEKPLDRASIDAAAPTQRADALLAAIRAACPGSAPDLIATDGWADESIWVFME